MSLRTPAWGIAILVPQRMLLQKLWRFVSCEIFCCLDKAAPHVGMLAARLAARLAAVTAADAGTRDSDADALFEALPAISGRSGQALRQQVIALQGDVDELTMDVVAERALPGLGHCRDLTHRPLHGCRSMHSDRSQSLETLTRNVLETRPRNFRFAVFRSNFMPSKVTRIYIRRCSLVLALLDGGAISITPAWWNMQAHFLSAAMGNGSRGATW